MKKREKKDDFRKKAFNIRCRHCLGIFASTAKKCPYCKKEVKAEDYIKKDYTPEVKAPEQTEQTTTEQTPTTSQCPMKCVPLCCVNCDKRK